MTESTRQALAHLFPEAAEEAAAALGYLANKNAVNQDAIREAGAIAPLVALLDHRNMITDQHRLLRAPGDLSARL